MKRILCVLLIIVMCVSVAACDNANNEDVGKKYLSGDPIRHKVFSYSINPDGKTCTITGFDWENPSTRIYS